MRVCMLLTSLFYARHANLTLSIHSLNFSNNNKCILSSQNFFRLYIYIYIDLQNFQTKNFRFCNNKKTSQKTKDKIYVFKKIKKC